MIDLSLCDSTLYPVTVRSEYLSYFMLESGRSACTEEAAYTAMILIIGEHGKGVTHRS